MDKSKGEIPSVRERKEAIVTMINVLLCVLASIDDREKEPCIVELEKDLYTFIVVWDLPF
jgi:hypothetical protein